MYIVIDYYDDEIYNSVIVGSKKTAQLACAEIMLRSLVELDVDSNDFSDIMKLIKDKKYDNAIEEYNEYIKCFDTQSYITYCRCEKLSAKEVRKEFNQTINDVVVKDILE